MNRPLSSRTRVPRARDMRGLGACACVAACAMGMFVATAATPVAGAAGADAAAARAEARSWDPMFDDRRAVPTVDTRRVVVLFDDPSLGEWTTAAGRPMAGAAQRTWVRRAMDRQQRRLDALAASGVQFEVDHRLVRVVNGVSLTVHGDGAQLLRSVKGVRSVSQVRTVWPAALESSAAGRAASANDRPAPAADAADDRIRVAVLDAAPDRRHPSIAAQLRGPGWDATTDAALAADVAPDPHGTAVASMVLRGAGDHARDVSLLPVRVLERQPARDGVEAVYGSSDDVLAGLEHAVDPNADGATDDGVDVALVAATTPYASFANSPEARSVDGARGLGVNVVAAAGNDGDSGDDVGTVGSFGAAGGALTVGAADLRARATAATLRVRGDGVDHVIEDAPVLTAGIGRLPGGERAIVAIDGRADEAVDYLDAELRSRVSGAVALVRSSAGTDLASQVRAAADAGATAVLVASADADAATGTVDAIGADIPAIALEPAEAGALRDLLADGAGVGVTLAADEVDNDGFGSLAGFSSGGPTLDGAARPDGLAPGVGMLVAGDSGEGSDGWRTMSGTSIAAAWAAGEVAALRSLRPDWDADTVRAALLATAVPLGSAGDRPAVAGQGAGVLDADAAARASWIAAGGRIDFGAVAPGATARRALGLRALRLGSDDTLGEDAKILLDDGGADGGVTPMLDGDELVFAAPAAGASGVHGGWLVLPDQGIRIPWSVTVREAAGATVPLDASLSTERLRPIAGPGAFAGMLTVAVGGEAQAGTLGIEAVQRLEVRLFDASGRDRGSVGGLEQALPGIYTFGITGVGANGKRLRPGSYELRIRYLPAADPAGAWRAGPSLSMAVVAPDKRSKTRS